MALTVVYDLDADLAKLGSFESAWKAQKEKLTWAADTINNAANSVVGEGWSGPAATRYNSHRGKLVADLDECADLAGKAAAAVGACIHTLRFNQGQLENEKAKLKGKVPMTEYGAGGAVELNPEDGEEDQIELVDKLVKSYNEIRGRVDTKLNVEAGEFKSAMAKFKAFESTWSRRTLRTLNWNVQQGGGGNKLWGQGHQIHDMGELAQRLIDGKVDVATLQEMFGDGAQLLQVALDKQDADGNWVVHFGPASMKGQWTNSGFSSEFGNAVAVRTGSGLTAGDPTVADLGDGDEGRSSTRVRVTVDR
ncbi:hypothetical protein [Nocardia sp. XZ_19_385]|uniref:hypothetical protein n=1 Tax=Nocardia sp. XZ_19_385 TaxID=2769488 RepID=UPI0018902D49|nr:hypothetical protein [Nocardia sp. XZ_19_385]